MLFLLHGVVPKIHRVSEPSVTLSGGVGGIVQKPTQTRKPGIAPGFSPRSSVATLVQFTKAQGIRDYLLPNRVRDRLVRPATLVLKAESNGL